MAVNIAIDGPAGAGKSTIAKAVAKEADISIVYEDGVQQVILNGENVTPYLRKEEVGNMASVSSGNPVIREKLVELQRKLAARSNVVMDGRDIGTCVLPNADIKIYLTASVATRALRRCKELEEKGIPCSLEEIQEDICQRDKRDMEREISPLRQAEDAVLVDSSEMNIQEVKEEILHLYREKTREGK